MQSALQLISENENGLSAHLTFTYVIGRTKSLLITLILLSGVIRYNIVCPGLADDGYS